jgi:hypothetical protein
MVITAGETVNTMGCETQACWQGVSTKILLLQPTQAEPVLCFLIVPQAQSNLSLADLVARGNVE